MGFVLFRVDDRLIHGQVTVAWGAWLSPDLIVLANDEVAETEWKREMYSSTDSMGVRIRIVPVDAFTAEASAGQWEDVRTLVVVESPRDLLRLVKAGVRVEEANIGGMHFADGKREVLPFVYVDESDVQAMGELIGLGVKLEARDVPQAAPADVWALIGRHAEREEGTGA